MDVSDELGYLCRIVDGSEIPTGLTNGGFSAFASKVLGMPEESILESIKTAGIISDSGPEAPFRPLGVFSFNPEPETLEKMISRMLNIITGDNLARNFLILFMARYRFSAALLETIIETHGSMLRITSENCAYAVMTSDFFLQAEAVNRWAIQQETALRSASPVSMNQLLSMDWFLSIIKVLRDENSGSFHGNIGTIIESMDENSLDVLISAISSGILPTLATQNKVLCTDEQIRQAFLERTIRHNEARRLKRFYYWLGIANDLSLGLEFVIGSVEFFPSSVFAGANDVLGVYLFITGSSQLVARSLIQIVMQLHLRRSRKKSSRRVSELTQSGE